MKDASSPVRVKAVTETVNVVSVVSGPPRILRSHYSLSLMFRRFLPSPGLGGFRQFLQYARSLMTMKMRGTRVHTSGVSHIIIPKTDKINEDLDLVASLQVRNNLGFSFVLSISFRMNMRGNTRNWRHMFKTTSTLSRPNLLQGLRRTRDGTDINT